MHIKIENLQIHPEYINTVVDWLYSEWGNNNYNYWKSWVKNSLCSNDIPQTFVAFVDGVVAGTYSLWRCDLQSRQDLYPWFGGLYVCPTFRGKIINGFKLGTHLQNHAIKHLRQLGYKYVYLFTEKNPQYYIYNGWQIIGQDYDEKDQLVTVCKYNLADYKETHIKG